MFFNFQSLRQLICLSLLPFFISCSLSQDGKQSKADKCLGMGSEFGGVPIEMDEAKDLYLKFGEIFGNPKENKFKKTPLPYFHGLHSKCNLDEARELVTFSTSLPDEKLSTNFVVLDKNHNLIGSLDVICSRFGETVSRIIARENDQFLVKCATRDEGPGQPYRQNREFHTIDTSDFSTQLIWKLTTQGYFGQQQEVISYINETSNVSPVFKACLESSCADIQYQDFVLSEQYL